MRASRFPRRTVNHHRVASVSALALVLAACAGDGVGPVGVVASVTLTPRSDAIVFGTRTQLTATAKDAAGNVLSDRTVTWFSSDTAVAAVTSSGLVTGVGLGSATITATADGKNGTASITVTPLVFASVSAGDLHSCGFTIHGVVYCWGNNATDQLGTGSATSTSEPTPIASDLTFRSVTTGSLHSCGLTTDGAGYCWGANAYGQRGIGGATANQTTPQPVAGNLTFRSLSAGRWHTCAVTTTGAAYCWGANSSGQLGAGSTAHQKTPQAVAGNVTFESISAGRQHTCGVSTDGVAYCWGHGGSGRLGHGSTTDRHTPEPVSAGLTFQSVSAGTLHTCAIGSDGASYCWGSNTFGLLGIDASYTESAAPVPLSGGHSFASVSAGDRHSCGLTSDGLAYCWGINVGGELGNGSADEDSHASPEAVSGGWTFKTVSAGFSHSCGVTIDGAAYCWGWNGEDQLGSGNTSSYHTTPVLVLGQESK